LRDLDRENSEDRDREPTIINWADSCRSARPEKNRRHRGKRYLWVREAPQSRSKIPPTSLGQRIVRRCRRSGFHPLDKLCGPDCFGLISALERVTPLIARRTITIWFVKSRVESAHQSRSGDRLDQMLCCSGRLEHRVSKVFST